MKYLPAFLFNAGQILLGQRNSSTTSNDFGTSKSCPVDTPLSCQTSQSSALAADTCCLNSPGGQFSQTQFWNSDPSRGKPGYIGPETSWTIHGLWPDHCDGRYDSVCDCDRSGDCSSRNKKCRNTCNRVYGNIENLLKQFGQLQLLEYMSQYWKGLGGDENLHQHEWSKHGTCISTLEPRCYDNYVPGQEVVDYFRVAVDLFRSLPTFEWLSEAGIVPSKDKSYTRDEILAALKVRRGVSAIIGCQGHELREVWYFYNVRGSLQNGMFEASEPDFSGNGGHPGASCPTDGILYMPKQV